MSYELKITADYYYNMKYILIIFLTFNFSLLTFHCFGQFSKKDRANIFYEKQSYEKDGMNIRGTVGLAAATNKKSAMLSYLFTTPASNIARYLKWDINFGGRFGVWDDKTKTTDSTAVKSIGFLGFPLGTGLTFRLLNPFNVSVSGGGFGGVAIENMFSKPTGSNESQFVFTVGYFASANMFFTLKQGLAIDLGYHLVKLKHINNLSYISLGIAIGGQ
jgi:hypothetical protein